MSHDEPPSMGRWERLLFAYTIWIWAGPLLLLLLVVALYYAIAYSGGTTPTTRSSSTAKSNDFGVETARQGLSRQTDLSACRNALQQISAELGDKTAIRPPTLTGEQKDWLLKNLHLDKEELSEVDANHYTRLDQHHLFRCFLMRDVWSNALAVQSVRGKPGTGEQPLDRAVRAFAWVMREVRLRPEEGEASPPHFVVRRGFGSALERALIFLALLEQIGDTEADSPELLGCLLLVPDDSGTLRLWTCGVVDGESKNVYLFDPYLGLPLPGPNGKGIATLAQAREQAEILAQFNFDKKYRYPATREQARAARAQLVCPLSALTPRMRFLQDKLLAPAVRIRLACDSARNLERIKTACSAVGAKSMPVEIAKDKCTLLRRFLAVDEGGADTSHRELLFQRNLIPWERLPEVFQNERLFPQNSELGNQVRTRFGRPFYNPTMEPGYSRDLLLRGRFNSAVEKLVVERGDWRRVLAQQTNHKELQQQFSKWLDEATRAYADKLRAKTAEERQQAEQKIAKLWAESGLPIHIYLSSSAAAARSPELAYQLGLCGQEQAEQLQARLDLQARAGVSPHPQDADKARVAWQNALDNWKRFEEDYSAHSDIAAARRLLGRAESMLGDHRAAIASWKKVAESPALDLEKLAALFLAQQWEKQHAGKGK